jgi:hypothetical protein
VSKIYPSKRREWLDLYDSGQSEAAIAKSAHRDVRTIKRGISQARRERDLRAARVELLKNALKQHQNRLIDTMAAMKSALVLPADEFWGTLKQIGLPGATATHTTGEGWSVALAVEDRPEWDLLQEHLKGDPMWASLAAWKKALALHVEARMNLKDSSARLMERRTGLKFVGQFAKPPFLCSDTTLPLVYLAVLRKALGTEEKTDFEEMIVVDRERGEVKYGLGTPLAVTPGKEEKCRQNILATLAELFKSTEAKRVTQTWTDLQQATAKISRSVEEILLFEMVPGECRVCRRLG